MTLDLRLAPAALAAWAVAFLGVLVPPTVAVVGAALLLLLAGRAAWSLRGGGRHRDRAGPTPQATAALALVVAALVLGAVAAHVHQRASGLLTELTEAGAVVTVSGPVTGDPAVIATPPERGGGERVTVPVRADLVVGRGLTARARAPVLLLAPPTWTGVELGARVRLTGRLVATEPGEDVAALVVVHADPEVEAPPPAHQRLASRMRGGLVAAVADAPAQARGLVPGIAVGDDSRLPPELDDAMTAVSLTHITAVSGAHVAIVLGAVLAGLSWAPRWLRAAVGGAVLVCFVVLVRPEASVLRSATMGGVALLALLLGRPARALPALCSAVMVLLLLDPWLARSYGFVLSVLATTGLVVLSGPWAEALSRRMPRTLAHVVAVPAAAQVCCAPVVILLEPAVATYAIPANVLAAPAVPPATVLGVVATVVSPWLPAATEPLAAAAGWFTGWIAWVALGWAELPGARLPWLGGLAGAALLAAVTVLAVVVARRGRRAQLLGAGVGALVLALALVPGPRRALGGLVSAVPDDWLAVQCDVGQGSGFALRSGPRSAVVVDVGPEGPAAADCLVAAGVREVDLLVLTHLHADHVAGLPEVLDAVEVHHVLLTPHDGPAAAERQVLAALAEEGATVERVGAGTAGEVAGVRWRGLWPTPRALELATPGDDDVANDLSLVVRLETAQLSVLALGDLEPDGQRGLLNELAAGGEAGPVGVDVVLVPHHGSAAQLPALAEAVGGRLALVSVGADNDFGHPAPATLELYGRGGALVLRTDECGGVVVVPAEGGLGAQC
ncbi:competence protein ComEC [Georgenia satyanarayanai]|uniref:Competence protein ComEC n=1 Tax=Georgenia satyanarayanai TaxID=860221 RepID=A0A2Y9A1N6_9MICO|nr:ComEC/Rec2 family competence protein [Georgenia satyanarayanai]PYG01599.1 competence protein ComEC [Georgenia satyanarayanai]SSA36399.1 competence protein ComEC [Georgenia satyanarayanai]